MQSEAPAICDCGADEFRQLPPRSGLVTAGEILFQVQAQVIAVHALLKTQRHPNLRTTRDRVRNIEYMIQRSITELKAMSNDSKLPAGNGGTSPELGREGQSKAEGRDASRTDS